jgi:hypothetical protein
MSEMPYYLLVASIALNGVVVGASLDQSIKQLPARHRINAIKYSAYSRAADLGNGIAWYGAVGVGAVLITFAAAIATYSQRGNSTSAPFIYVAAVLSILHSLATSQAAPIMFSQRRHENDERALASVFDRFERWQTLRVLLQVFTLAVLLWALALNAG